MTINCGGKLIDLSTPHVMGIINVTPDSFYAESRSQTEKDILGQAEKMLEEGAKFLDVGGYSTRPGAQEVSVEEEANRVTRAVKVILDHFPEAVISVDSFRESVVRKALNLGALVVNDVSAGNLDPKMLATVATYQVPYIMMHMRGTPQTMKEHTDYSDLIIDIRKYFSERISAARRHGINDLIIDLGFGFAKTIDQNFELLKNLEHFKHLGLPILTGISRKSTIYKTLGISAGEALNGTTALHMVALMNGSNILRAHDVKPAMECIELYNNLT